MAGVGAEAVAGGVVAAGSAADWVDSVAVGGSQVGGREGGSNLDQGVLDEVAKGPYMQQ